MGFRAHLHIQVRYGIYLVGRVSAKNLGQIAHLSLKALYLTK